MRRERLEGGGRRPWVRALLVARPHRCAAELYDMGCWLVTYLTHCTVTLGSISGVPSKACTQMRPLQECYWQQWLWILVHGVCSECEIENLCAGRGWGNCNTAQRGVPGEEGLACTAACAQGRHRSTRAHERDQVRSYSSLPFPSARWQLPHASFCLSNEERSSSR